MHIKKGDKVIVIAGKERGKTGEVSRVFPKKNQVLIEGMNMKKSRRRPRQQGEKGEVLEVAAPIHASNVQLAEGKKGVRTGFKIEKDKKVRVSKASGKAI